MAHELTRSEWRRAVQEAIPVFGHRNWIAVVDSAFPSQSSGGIEMILAEAEHLDVVRCVLEKISGSAHLRPSVCVDAELDHIDDDGAPGITQYRRELDGILSTVCACPDAAR